MKRWVHYKEDTAILLAAFGSIPEKRKYEDLKKYIQSEIPGVPVYLSFASKSVIKALKKEDITYKNLAQMLSDLDLEGYRRIVVSSVNLFPTDEHEYLKNTVEGFNHFSLSRIIHTGALFSKVTDANRILKEVDDKIKDKYGRNNYLYIVHGAPYLDQPGSHSISYTRDFLKSINPLSLFCSLEHDYQFKTVGESLLEAMELSCGDHDLPKEVKIIPLLLSSGNHFDLDVKKIKEYLGKTFQVDIVESFYGSNKFNLLELDVVKSTIKRQIKEIIKKMQ
ncbi:MAG: sirohydrochlorin cobaltochelatase [bacterium]|nr:MAG: sirohydrochlorin cobaltochelatase [bacterium]